MCNAVHFDGRWHQTPSELASLVGGAQNLLWHDGAERVMDSCLCSIDVGATLSRSAYTWQRGADPMEWFASRDLGS
jgi:hypothetical protein